MARKESNHIVVMRDEDIWIEGPFNTLEELRAAGDAIQDRDSDDPRWQSIYLAEGHPALVLRKKV